MDPVSQKIYPCMKDIIRCALTRDGVDEGFCIGPAIEAALREEDSEDYN